jgi:hypothetical protein
MAPSHGHPTLRPHNTSRKSLTDRETEAAPGTIAETERPRPPRRSATRQAFRDTVGIAIQDIFEDHPRRSFLDISDIEKHLDGLLVRSEIVQALDDLAEDGGIDIAGTDCGAIVQRPADCHKALALAESAQ